MNLSFKPFCDMALFASALPLSMFIPRQPLENTNSLQKFKIYTFSCEMLSLEISFRSTLLHSQNSTL